MAKFTNVLLIEDDPITVMVCERIIYMTSFADKVTSCKNGMIAMDYLHSAPDNGVAPDIIFLDINMPVMNGWEFLKELEKDKAKYVKLPEIYILSSTVDPEDYKKANSFSMVQSFISKPLNREILDKIN